MPAVIPPTPPTPPSMPQFDAVQAATGGMPDFSASGRAAVEGAQERADAARSTGEQAASNAGDAGRRMQAEPVRRESSSVTDNRTPEAREADAAQGNAGSNPQTTGTTNINQVQRNVIEGTNLPPAASETGRSTQAPGGVDPDLLTPGRHDASSSLFTILPMVILAGIIVGVLWQKFMRGRTADNSFLEGFGGVPSKRPDTSETGRGDGAKLLQDMQEKRAVNPASIPRTPRRHKPPLTLADRMHALAEATKNAELRTGAAPSVPRREPPSAAPAASPPPRSAQPASQQPGKQEEQEKPTKRFEIRI
ncbi:hypothetical protein TAMA11512_20310 [Selenomonas sp. TAMA-11512]|uniref:hypothetical protein n=1 Tax=Selenomonas sp. TAMA-11512 TaxID=3095337 RepID=UPI003091908D|nr:hypothetical protein TAMA11512_20310 [Selenomonas sp. TAMA-11512]